MFIANNQNNQLVSLIRMKEADKKRYCQTKFFCPACKEEVLLKWGKVKQPHFAHKTNSRCQSFSEGETQEHLQGKYLLARACEEAGIAYELEAFLPALNQRPDLLLQGKLAIEFQCSPLSIEKLKERTEGYRSHGYEVWWILGKKRVTNPEGRESLKAFCYYGKTGFYYWFLDVDRKILEKRENLHYCEVGKLHYQRQTWQIESRDFWTCLASNAMDPPVRREWRLGKSIHYQQYLIHQALIRQQPVVMKIQEELYVSGKNLYYLPLPCFLPLFYSFLLGPKELLWKTMLWAMVSSYETHAFSYEELLVAFKKKLATLNLRGPLFPLVPQFNLWEWFLQDYLYVLLDFGYIEKSANCYSIKKREVWFHSPKGYDEEIQQNLEKYKATIT